MDSNLYLAEAKSADAVLPNTAAGASAPMLQFESPASAGLSNFLSCSLLFCMHPPALERADLLQYTFGRVSSRR